MIKLIVFLTLITCIFSADFRGVQWGMSRSEVFEKESLERLEYSEKKINITFPTYKGDMLYRYSKDEYTFYDEIESLGTFKVTYTFLEDKLIKSSYEQLITNDYSNFNRLRQYLTWKYGTDYRVYGFNDNFVWSNDRTRIVLDLIPNRNFVVEYYANTPEILAFISSIEKGRDFLDEVGSDFEEFNNIRDRI